MSKSINHAKIKNNLYKEDYPWDVSGQYCCQKTAKDGANSKVLCENLVSKIYVAAKEGEPDPESNSTLKFVLERAKQAQVPKHVIDRAIDKSKR